MFAFAVHPLTPWQRRVVGVRRGHLLMAVDRAADIDAVGEVARVELHTRLGSVQGLILGVPDLAPRLVQDQARALELQIRAAHLAEEHGARALGLGSALAAVAGRGKILARMVQIPITSGQAATAWAASEVVRQLTEGRAVGVLGFSGAVGDAVTARLCSLGLDVLVEDSGGRSQQRAEEHGALATSKEQLLSCAVVVGASTTGPTLHPQALRQGTILVDLALPPTLHPGPLPSGVRVVAGEALALPGTLRAGFWGRVWLLMAAYGPGALYACVAEPLAVSMGLAEPTVGRRIPLSRVNEMGLAMEELGFVPVIRPRQHTRLLSV